MEILIEKEVAYYLGKLKRGFESGELNEDTIENAYDTRFVFNMDNGKSLRIKGKSHVRCADFLSSTNPIKMIFTLTGGNNVAM